MLKLTDIKKTKTYIEALYIPEGTDEKGYVKIDLKTDKVVEKKLTSCDKTVTTYFNMARFQLRSIKDDENIPEETTVMWY